LGATGKQGGACAKYLSKESQFTVRAMSRDPSKPAALELKNQGMEIVAGNFDSKEDLRKAMEGVYGVVSVQDFWITGMEKEILQGKNVAEIANEAQVKHFVYLSIANCDHPKIKEYNVEHWISKHEIEEEVKKNNLPFTFVRTVMFMDYFLKEMPYLCLPIFKKFFSLNHPLYMVDTDDIGRLVTEVFKKTRNHRKNH